MGKSSKLALSLLFSTAFVGVPSLVWAQAATPPSAPPVGPQDQGGNGPAIIVTATRQATNIQKTPVQVTAFSAQKLQDANVLNLEDVTYLAPSVRFTINSGSGQTAIAMRGIGSSPSAYAVAGVQVYEEEVPLAGAALNLSPYDVSNIQVLEGPQGTLFGRNTLAGAVLIEPKLPSFNQDAYLKAGYGSFNYWTVEGAGNLTLLPDVLALRVAGQIQRRDGDIQSLSPTIGPQGNLATEAFRASLLFTPTSNFKDVLTVDYFHEADTGNPVMIYNPDASPNLPYPYPFYLSPIFGQPTSPAVAAALAACHHTCIDYGSTPQSDLFFLNEHTSVFNTTTWSLTPNLELKNIFGFQATNDEISEMTLPALVPLFVAQDFQPQDRITEEVQLIGHAVDNRLELRGGFYYENDWSTGLDAHNTVGVAPAFQSAGQKQQSYALYGDVSFKATDRLTFRGGFRYTWDKQQSCLGNGINGGTATGTSEDCNASAAQPGGGPLMAVVGNFSDAAPTWSYGLDYQVTNNIFLYFTGSRGYRAPALNPVFSNPCLLGGASMWTAGTPDAHGVATPTNPTGTPITNPGGVCGNDIGLAYGGPATGRSINLSSVANLMPETIDNFEGGFKTQWHLGDWRMTFNFDLFHYIYKDAEDQLNLGSPTTVIYDLLAGCANCAAQTTFGSVTYNGGTVTATGFEGELALAPTRDLTFDAHFSYLDQQVSLAIPSVLSGAGLNAAQSGNATSIGAASTIQQLAAPTAPWSFTIAMNYVLPWHPLRGDLVLNYDYFWTAGWFAQNLPVPGYDLHNIRLDWNNIGGSNVSAGVWVRNLLDRDYELGAVDQPIGATNWGEPRMVGFDITARFH